jgi:Tol biopolymer transport system component
LQDLDINAHGDVVVIDRGHRLTQSLWKYTANLRKVEFVTRAPRDLRVPLLSPDGRWISFILRNELHFAHLKGARP